MENPKNEQLVAANKAAIDSLLAVANTAMATAESYAALNLLAAKETINAATTNSTAALRAKSPEQLAALHSAAVQPAMQSGVDYFRNVYEISSGAAGEFSKLIQAQFVQFNKATQEIAEKAAAASPFGADAALAAVKQASAAMTKAYDYLNKVTKQASDLAQENVNSLNKATKNK